MSTSVGGRQALHAGKLRGGGSAVLSRKRLFNPLETELAVDAVDLHAAAFGELAFE